MIAAIGILIAIELSGIAYFLSQIRQMAKMLNLENADSKELNSLFHDLNSRFTRGKLYKTLMILVVIPSMTIEAYGIWTGAIYTYYSWEKTLMSFAVTIIYYSIVYFVSFLLATVIWIMINLSYFLNRLADEEILSKLHINIFCGFQIGVLNHAKDILMKFAAYYFICVAFAILSYISPAQLISYQMLFYAFIDLLGILILLSGWLSLRKIYRRKWQIKVKKIDDLYNDNYRELTKLLSKDRQDETELMRLSSALDVLQKQRERLTQIIKGDGNFLNAIQIFCSFLATILAFAIQAYKIINHQS